MLLKYQKFPLFSYIIQGENYLNWILTLLNTRFGQVADSTFSWLYCLAIVTLTMPIWQYLVFPMGSLSTKDICDGRPGTFLNCDFSLSLKSESACRVLQTNGHIRRFLITRRSLIGPSPCRKRALVLVLSHLDTINTLC